jgi:sec-independent protein translocase protein TatA
VHFSSPAEIFGVDGIIILVVVVLVLFGSTQIPKLARSLGSAQKEFKQGQEDGDFQTKPGRAPVALVVPSTVDSSPRDIVTVEPAGAAPLDSLQS